MRHDMGKRARLLADMRVAQSGDGKIVEELYGALMRYAL